MHLELLEQILISQGETNARLELIQAEVERLQRAVIALLQERAVAAGKLSGFFTPAEERDGAG